MASLGVARHVQQLYIRHSDAIALLYIIFIK